MTLHIVRHGESAGNVRGIIQGSLDLPLTERGRTQAERVAHRLHGRPIAAVYSSPLRRAAETADAIGARLSLPVTPEPALTEYGFGAAEGLPWAEVRRRWRLADGDWGRGLVPGEEGTAAFRARVWVRVWALLERHPEEDAVLVAHGGVIGAVVAQAWGLGERAHAQIYAANGGITSLGVVRGAPTVLHLNDCCHLERADARAVPRWQAPATSDATGDVPGDATSDAPGAAASDTAWIGTAGS